MRKLRSALCLLCLLLLAPLLARAWRMIPLDNQPLVSKKYAAWSGVLRLWAFEGWAGESGGLGAWLNRCAARFEKGHPGVYVQPQFVDAGALADFNDSGVLPPDMLLFPPGLLDAPDGLLPLSAPGGLRRSAARCGVWGDVVYAAPVAMGGYMWALNRSLIDGIPPDWRDVDAAPAAPEPEEWRRWDAALLALCAGMRAPATVDEADARGVEPAELDLGIAATGAPAPAATPSADAAAVPRRLPEGFRFEDDAWRSFANGEAAVLPVTQREVRRLQRLSEQGKGPDWQLCAGDAVFSDQLLCLGIVEKPGAEAQQALCREFLDCLLGDECQGDLNRVPAFGVTDAPSGYAPGDPLAAMEALLRADGLAVPNCFDDGWAEDAKNIVREFIDGAALSTDQWRALRARLTKNPNNS